MGDVLPVSVTVVIPTRNEEEAIVDTIRSVPDNGWCNSLDFLIIDGNSSDRTRELAEKEGAEVYLEPRRGYGRAYRTGFAMANGDIIVTMDADCTYPGEEVPGLVRQLLEEDLEFITCDRLKRAEKYRCLGYTVLATGPLFTSRCYSGMAFTTHNQECGFSERGYSKTRR